MTKENDENFDVVSAAMVVIGDEILSGRTRDTNAGHLASIMTAIGIDLKEVRFVSDDQDAIIEAVNQLRERNTYVFTSGGIGPTHDDITADAIAAAFGLPCDYDDQALKILAEHYKNRGIEFTESRKRMARMPEGAHHIDNPISKAPGFVVGNVHVMAGVPSIFQAMLDHVVHSLRTGRKLLSKSVLSDLGEGTIGAPLGEVQKNHPDTVIGSYPRYEDGNFSTELVVRSANEASLDSALEDIKIMLSKLQNA
ncbi:competence/damage-inducible protein A [Ahrensia kielensis]|uniref:competence/damage-inducible protein A n=1 Tax=Ahrensia kielensis TaxID=76980 RepID=UPI00037E3BF7|nr:molybdopterin-binding protein [Ahrensia kielensis]